MLIPSLPQLSPQVWVLVAGRFLSQIGSGVVLFYVPIYFVNQVGLSATAVGIGLSSGAIASAVGYFLAGSMTDSRVWGCRRTLILSCIISILADGVFWFAHSFPFLILANLLMGLGDSLYWPASGAAITDRSQDSQREEAFAVSGLADSLGSGLGIVLGGMLISIANSYQLLFIVDGLTFFIFLIVLTIMLKDSRQAQPSPDDARTGLKAWKVALLNPLFLVFAIANILFTTYINLMESTMPLYFTNFVHHSTATGMTPGNVGVLFSGYVLLAALCQLPMVRLLQNYHRVYVLMLSMVLWGIGFLLVWFAGISNGGQMVFAVLAIALLAIANITYNPFAVALVTELAPRPSLGIYLALNAQCWTVGYLVGPLIGGWALAQNQETASGLWAAASFSTLIGVAILRQLETF
ncbi:MFS transporter [Thermocoleostomius sinensis]|uniref:MFS transporter n=1 Tax=Thermocoleostomius sinensis A174 TaxID=2016057 RepID=A0A9E8ZEG6_9CYAN|nr:MFS transporter [Thermocoleostomius sinensis]WAL59873.1 MFS transporter [Thermocoleostomius sinensis A174]